MPTMHTHRFVVLLELCMTATIIAATSAFASNAKHTQVIWPAFRRSLVLESVPGAVVDSPSTPTPYSVLRSLRGGARRMPPTASIEKDDEVIDLDAPSVANGSSLLGAAVVAPLTGFGRFYSTQLEAFPILTKSATAGVIFALSDYLAQRIERSSKEAKLDWTRLVSSGLVGLLYFGPAAHYWYEAIFYLLPSTTLTSTLAKAFWGQVVFGPSFTCIFFAVSLLQSGNFTLNNWWKKIRNDLPGAWLAGVGFWPLVDLVSYSIVPVKWIPLFINMCSLVWTVYLSIVANRSSGNAKSKN